MSQGTAEATTQAAIAAAVAAALAAERARELPLDEDEIDLRDIFRTLARHWRSLVIVPLIAGLIALGITYLIPPKYTAKTLILPPQQQQSSAMSALASLGAVAGLAGVSGAIKTPADQYLALLESVSASDRIIEKFGLMKEYDAKYRFEARKHLANNTTFSVGKKDGLMSIEVIDTSPRRAADMANAYVDELRRMTSSLAVSEAQQRRVFFEQELRSAKESLTAAQSALQASGFNGDSIKTVPQAAAEGYAKLRAELTSAQVTLRSMRQSLADESPQLRQQAAVVNELEAQLAKLEKSSAADVQNGQGYVSLYREFKYRETLMDMMARQYEIARVDESREGALIQVVDKAGIPEYKSSPKRAMIAAVVTILAALCLGAFILVRQYTR